MQFGQSETQKRGKKNGLSDGKKCMLIFRRLYTGRRKEKIQGTYFKICALYFKISQTYFLPFQIRVIARQTKTTVFSYTLIQCENKP